jgi:hypothetical protein
VTDMIRVDDMSRSCMETNSPDVDLLFALIDGWDNRLTRQKIG